MSCEKNAAGNDLLLIIDMQNVYTKGQEWACCGTDNAAKSTLKLLSSCHCPDVIFTQYLACENPKGVWKEYNRINASINSDPWLNAIIPALLPWTKKYPIYSKSVYSSLAIPQVKEAAAQARRVLISGVVAECCVLSTVLAAIDEGCQVIYLKDAVSGLTPRSERETENLISYFSPLHTKIVTTDEYLLEAASRA